MINCLMTNGGALSDHYNHALYLMAVSLFRKGEKKLTERCDHCGISLDVRTRFDFGCIGAISGTKFSGTIESDGHETVRVEFIVRRFDLEHREGLGFWSRGDLSSIAKKTGMLN